MKNITINSRQLKTMLSRNHVFNIYVILFIFSFSSLYSQTTEYEDLLSHRSGFGKNVTGGAGGEVVIITSLTDGSFQTAAESSGAKWIRFTDGLTGVIKFEGNLNLESNKTIDGRGANITISAPRDNKPEVKFSGEGKHNLIIHNITFDNIGTGNNNGMGFSGSRGAHDIWIDHCTYKRIGDESISLGYGGTDLTVSYCHFDKTEKGGVISWGENEPGVSDTIIRLTIHHCYYDDVNRTPALRYGKAHLYNNYIKD